MKSKFNFSAESIARALLVVAALVSGYLAWVSFTASGIAGCGEGAACSKVLSSQWASVFGLPVALLGAGLYLAAAFFGAKAKGFTAVSLALPVTILLAAVWFVSVQVFAVGEFCLWCCSAHLLASAAAVIFLIKRPKSKSSEWMPAVGALVAVVGLAVAQSVGSGERSSQEGGAIVTEFSLDEASVKTDILNEVSLLEGKVTFRLDELPMIGGSQPQQVVVALTDYTCPHCRKLHDTLERVGVGLDGKVAILKLPATRKGTESAEIHRHMLAVWKVNRKAHWTLERAVIEGRVPATSQAVLAEAVRLVGGNQFAEASVEYNHWISEQIANTRKLQDANREKTGKGTLPQVMIGSELVLGGHSDPNYYVALAEKQFGLVAASKAPEETIERQSRAIEIEDGTIDLGNVKPGAEVPFRIAFTNTDQLPLQIQWLNMGAGITLEDFSRDEIDHECKAEVSLFLKVPEALRHGQIARAVTVHTSSGHAPISFKVTATVGASIASVQPGTSDTLPPLK